MTARTPRAISNDEFHQIKEDYPERSFAKAVRAPVRRVKESLSVNHVPDQQRRTRCAILQVISRK